MTDVTYTVCDDPDCPECHEHNWYQHRSPGWRARKPMWTCDCGAMTDTPPDGFEDPRDGTADDRHDRMRDER